MFHFINELMGGRQEEEINIRTNKITELITECLRKDLRTPACLFFFFSHDSKWKAKWQPGWEEEEGKILWA